MKKLSPRLPILSYRNREYAKLIGHVTCGIVPYLARLLMRKDCEEILQELVKKTPWCPTKLRELTNYKRDVCVKGVKIPHDTTEYGQILEGLVFKKWTKLEVLEDISQLYAAVFGIGLQKEPRRAEEERIRKAEDWEQRILRFVQKIRDN